MNLSSDLTPEALATVTGTRALRSYAALVSTGSAAYDWAGSGAPDGSVVLAGYQLSPRGHAGRSWSVDPERGLGFSLVMRPRLDAEREGWLYTVVLTALAEVCGEESTIEWPDEVRREGATVALAGIKTRLGEQSVEWAVVDVLIPGAEPPRGDLLGAVLAAIEARRAEAPDAVIDAYARRCSTIGRQVRMRFVAGTGPRVQGRAVGTLDDGALLLELEGGRRAPVRPQDVRGIEDA